MGLWVGKDVGPRWSPFRNMYHVSVLILCFLSVATFGNDTTTSQDTTTTTTVHPNSVPCNKSAQCDYLPGVHACINAACYDCYDCCANKRENCPKRKCYCTWFLSDEELKIVAQAVLGVAVFVTCVALVSLLWKVCARRLRRRRAAAAGMGADLLDDTTSLSSQQVFVVERLRDRPPRYEEAARDFAVEKPPPYSEVVQVEEVEQRRAQTMLVGGVSVTLVGHDLTAHDFAAPPPYSPPPVRAAALLPPTVPHTPPAVRLRRVVRKVVMIGRLRRRHNTAPDADDGSRPKGTSSQSRETVSSAAHASGGLTAASEPVAVGRGGGSQMEAGVSGRTVPGGTGDEGTVPGSPTSTTA